MWQWEVVSTVVFAVEEQQRLVVSEYAENEEVESRTHTQRTLPEETTQSRAAFLPHRWSACGGGGGEGIGGCDRGLAELWVDTKEKELSS